MALAYRYRGGPEGYAAAGLALAFADRAIEIDPGLSAGYAARGLLASRTRAPLSAVAEDCREALELDPNAADGLSWCGRVLKELGWANDALEKAQQAVNVDPGNAGRRVALAYDAMSLKRYGLAIEEARAAQALSPGLMLPRVLEARSLLMADRAAECLSIALGPHAVTRATCLHAVGRIQEAEAIVDSVALAVSSLETSDPVFSDLVRAEDLSVYYAWIGDSELALSWVRVAYDLSPWVESRVLESDIFASARARGDFQSQLEQIQRDVWPRVETAAEDARRSHPLLAPVAADSSR